MTEETADRNRAMAGFTIMPADAGDHDTLSTLHAACFTKAWTAHDFSELLATSNICALMAQDHEHSGTHCGFIVVRHAADEAEIITLGVVPSARRRGVAAALLVASLAVLEGGGVVTVFLEVAQDNTAARDFYRAHGFCDVGRRGGYYQGAGGAHGDAIVMCRNISSTRRS